MSLDYVINEQDGINEQGGQISKKKKISEAACLLDS